MAPSLKGMFMAPSLKGMFMAPSLKGMCMAPSLNKRVYGTFPNLIHEYIQKILYSYIWNCYQG